MNKGRRIAGFALLAGVAIGLTCYVTRPREPVYQGRALSEWLADLNDSDDPETWDKACEAVRQIGTNALPQIREMLRTEDSAVKKRINVLLRKQSVIKFRFKTAIDVHDVAFFACKALGPAAKEALPDLRRLLLNTSASSHCVFALENIGAEAVPILLEALTNDVAGIRFDGAFGLSLMGTNAQTAVPQLMAALKDTDLDTRLMAVAALAKLNQDPQIWMPVLLELVHHKDSDVWRTTIEYLGAIGNKAKEFIPTLLTALEDEDLEVRRRAAEALKKIDPEAAAKAGVK